MEQHQFHEENLTETFAHGWNKLPNELKLKIVGYNLILGVRINSYNKGQLVERHLLPYCRMTPELASLAVQVFYGSNRFRVVATDALHLPPQIHRHFLRHLEVTVRLDDDYDVLSILCRLQAAVRGLKNLRKFSILMYPPARVGQNPRLRASLSRVCQQKLHFEAGAGQASIGQVIWSPLFQLGTLLHSREISEFVEEAEGWLRKNFTFGVVSPNAA